MTFESKYGSSNWKIKAGDQLDILVSQINPRTLKWRVHGAVGLPFVFGMVAALSIIGAPIVYLALQR